MAKKKGFMKKFFGEFKTFITRGNVLDMAVGVIVGGAFTAIVNALSDHVLRPLINWVLALILGRDALSDIYTFLVRGYDENGVLSLENSIYIDWGAFINAIINFLLIAFVLFCIVKAINKFSEAKDRAVDEYLVEKKAIEKYRGEGLSKAEAKKRYAEELKKEREAQEEAERKAETNRLLQEIRDLLKREA